MKSKNNPMHSEKDCKRTVKYQFMHSSRCGARTRQGNPCQAPAIYGKARCRMHGGKGSGAPLSSQNALKHGYYTSDAFATRKEVAAQLKLGNKFIRYLQTNNI